MAASVSAASVANNILCIFYADAISNKMNTCVIFFPKCTQHYQRAMAAGISVVGFQWPNMACDVPLKKFPFRLH